MLAIKKLPWLIAACLFALAVQPASSQLPPDSVNLGKVKIAEVLKAEDLCPVHLVPSSAQGETWQYEGVTYRGSEPGTRAEFLTKPAAYAAAANKERWIKNFMLAMSTIWCPITDEVTPGGRKRVDGLGLTWESCCGFCDDEMSPENFADALVRLRDRAEKSFELTGGRYTEGAKSPVEGAIQSGR